MASCPDDNYPPDDDLPIDGSDVDSLGEASEEFHHLLQVSRKMSEAGRSVVIYHSRQCVRTIRGLLHEAGIDHN